MLTITALATGALVLAAALIAAIAVGATAYVQRLGHLEREESQS